MQETFSPAVPVIPQFWWNAKTGRFLPPATNRGGEGGLNARGFLMIGRPKRKRAPSSPWERADTEVCPYQIGARWCAQFQSMGARW